MAAEGLGFSSSSSFHVPQQSRRDKLRVPACEQQTTAGAAYGLLPPPPPPPAPNFYDPSALLQPHFLAPAPPLGSNHHHHHHPPSSALLADSSSSLNLKDELAAANNSHLHSPYVLHHHEDEDTDIHPFLYATATATATAAAAAASNFDPHSTHPSLSLAHTSNAQARLLSLSLSNSHPHHRPPTALVPLGPFTGYASILKASRFLKPAQELLEQLCRVDHASSISMSMSMSLIDPSMPMPIPMPITDSYDPCSTSTTNKMRLISLLEEVYRRYKLYYQQMQSIVSSFESVAGLGNAVPYASFALHAMSKHFKSLKNAITDQLHTFASKATGNEGFSKDESLVYGNSDRWVHCHRTIQNPGIFDHQPVWRPQRGLPERAVAVLSAWLFEHFLHPYPTDSDKQMLAKQTGLSRSQVSNWFINARVRLWKPMVEEIHMLETRQALKSSSDVEDQNSSQPVKKHVPTMNSPVSNNQVQTDSKHNTEEHSMKRSRNEFPCTMPNGSAEPINFSSYDKLSCPEHVEGGGISIAAGGNSGVSLTLGLRQNNGASLTELLPMNLARSFGVDPSNEGYIIGGFDGSNRQFGKNIGGYMLHDFVG